MPAPPRTGLVSVTFRKLGVPRVIELVAAAGLDGIEWGGDVHVPAGDAAAAADARRRTADAGLVVAAYGSYYRCDHSPAADAGTALTTAAALGAPTVRIWAGPAGSARTDAAAFARVADDVARVCDLAAPLGLTVTLECHGGTLTDTPESFARLLAAAGRPNLLAGWQPRDGLAADAGVAEIERLSPGLGNLHVFQWWPTGATRLPLADGAERWRAYFAAAAADGRERFALLEFVRGDEPDQFAEDAATLKRLLSPLPARPEGNGVLDTRPIG